MKSLSQIILITLILIQYTYSQKSYSFNFTILQKEKHFKSHAFLQFISQTKFCIGTPYQCKTVQFDPGTHLTFILNKKGQGDKLSITTFDKELSSTYHLKYETTYIFTSQKIISGVHAVDRLQLGLMELTDGEFFFADDWVSEHMYSVIGLKVDLRHNSYISYIDQLYNNTIIDAREYTIERRDIDSGTITFGKSIDNKSSLYKKILSTKLNLWPYSVGHFVSIQKLCIGNLNNPIDYGDEIISQLDESFGFIQMPLSIRQYIIEYYLKDLECEEFTYTARKKSINSLDFYYFICPKENVNSNTIRHDLLFVFKEGSIPLLKKDIFVDYNTISMIFAIIFKKGKGEPQFIIGDPILKHYRMRHSYDDLSFTFYSKGNEINGIIPSITSFESQVIYCLLMMISIMMVFGLCFIGCVYVKQRSK